MKKKAPKIATEQEKTALPSFALKRILVPVDFSAISINALHYALSFAPQFGASIDLLHVYEAASFMAGYQALPEIIAAPDAEVVQKLRIKLDGVASSHRHLCSSLHSFVREGKAYDQIVKFAEEKGADLIVIGTHGYTGLKHAVIGSTAERVVRHASCPVLVVRQ